MNPAIAAKLVVFGGAFAIGVGWSRLCEKVILPALGLTEGETRRPPQVASPPSHQVAADDLISKGEA